MLNKKIARKFGKKRDISFDCRNFKKLKNQVKSYLKDESESISQSLSRVPIETLQFQFIDLLNDHTLIEPVNKTLWHNLYSDKKIFHPRTKVDIRSQIQNMAKLEQISPEILLPQKSYFLGLYKHLHIWNQFLVKSEADYVVELAEEVSVSLISKRDENLVQMERKKMPKSFDNYVKSVFESELGEKASESAGKVEIVNSANSGLVKVKICASLFGGSSRWLFHKLKEIFLGLIIGKDIVELSIYLTDRNTLKSINQIKREISQNDSLNAYFLNNWSPIKLENRTVHEQLQVLFVPNILEQ